jgi:hypothetical protein
MVTRRASTETVASVTTSVRTPARPMSRSATFSRRTVRRLSSGSGTRYTVARPGTSLVTIKISPVVGWTSSASASRAPFGYVSLNASADAVRPFGALPPAGPGSGSGIR